MSATSTVKTIVRLIELAANEIDVVAARVKFEPAAQNPVAKILSGLSSRSKKTAAKFPDLVEGLSEERREHLIAALESFGVIDTMNDMIPLLELGHATDPGFLMHETAKTLYAAAAIADFADVAPVAGALETQALVLDIASQISGQNDSEQLDATIDRIEEKIDVLDQKISFIMDLSDGTPVPKTPRDSTPVSLTMIEDKLSTMDQELEIMDHKLSYIMDLPEGAEIPETPPDTKPVSLTTLEKMLEAAKKFYKFEGTFIPSFEKDKQLIRMGPLETATMPVPPVPLLVTGFIDLSGMEQNDVVTITTKVLEPTPTPRYVVWRVKTFTGVQVSGMKHFQDFADLLEVPGDGVEVLIAQSASERGFDPANLVTIPYQFLIESTTAPQFVLT